MFSFALVVDGIDLSNADSSAADALYEAGCDDAVLVTHDGEQQILFDRDANSFATAVATAISAVETAVRGARVLRVERLDLAGLPPRLTA